jgi:hypothetical protein
MTAIFTATMIIYVYLACAVNGLAQSESKQKI